MATTDSAHQNMDLAQQVLEEVIATQHKGLYETMDRGDSAVQQFYKDATVFVTGGSGFLGKQLIEKLFRSCQLKKLFVLLRPKKGKTIQERLEYVLKDPLYDVLRERVPNFVDKLVPIEGDVRDIRLGLNDKHWTQLTEEVDTVFHMAATIRFDETLRAATLTNVRGTRECLKLARECVKLKNFVYVSTAFSHATYERVGKPVLEQFYPCPIPPDVIIGMAESLDEEKLDSITNELTKGWPNTYTFTKAIAEEVVRSSGDLPVCIVRPPIVVPSYYEPMPGWMDLSTLSGPTGILTGVILGILHVFLVKKQSQLPMAPVDYVNNATIAAAWDAAVRRQEGVKDIQVYTVSHQDYYLTWDFIGKIMRSEGKTAPTPKAVWYCYLLETGNMYVYWILSFFLHYIPAYILDAIGTLTGNMPKDITSYVAVFRKIDKFALIYQYFLMNEWGFRDDNLQVMISRMSPADKKVFNCDIKTIDFVEWVKVWGVGIRKYIIQDGLKGSQEACKKQQKYLIANYFLISFYVLLVLSVLFNLWKFVTYLFLSF